MAFGSFGLVMAAVLPTPRVQDLAEVRGTLISHSVEEDRSWFAQHLARRGPTVYVLFRVAGQEGRFWNPALDPENVASALPHPGVELRFHVWPGGERDLVNGDGRKSYGLSVDGRPIRSVEEAVSDEEAAAGFWAGAGMLALLFGAMGIAAEVLEKQDAGPASGSA